METPPSKDRENFLEGMRYTASAVNIVTTDGRAGRAGVTVSAMTPVSADGNKPTLLVCVHHLSPACRAIMENQVFGVNILSQKQSHIADTFAGRIKVEDNDKFSCTKWIAGKTGVPLVLHSLVSFECQLLENSRVGSHHIFIGGVQNTRFQADELPLIYSNRAYGSPAKFDVITKRNENNSEGAPLRIGCPAHLTPSFIPDLISSYLDQKPSVTFSLLVEQQGNLLQSITNDYCDIAFLGLADPNPNLHQITLTQLQHLVVVPSDSTFENSTHVTLDTLVKMPLLYLETSLYPNIIDLFASKDFAPKPVVKTSSLDAVLDLVERGLGYTIIPFPSSSSLPIYNRKLQVLELKDCDAGNLVMVTSQKKNFSLLIDEFVEFSKSYFTKIQRSDCDTSQN